MDEKTLATDGLPAYRRQQPLDTLEHEAEHDKADDDSRKRRHVDPAASTQ